MRNPFKRRAKNQTIAELESYYATQGTKRRSGTAWVMALISLLITIVVIALLYFGVRWVYRTVTDDGNGSDTVATGTVDTEGGARVVGENPNADPRSPEDVEVGVLNPTDDENNQGGVVTDEAASTSRDDVSAVAGDNTTNTADSLSTTGGSEELPNTGAGESLLLLLASVTVIGYFSARKKQLNS
jgi:hypothetical protein